MFSILARGMEQIKAENDLRMMEVISYPHVDSKTRKISHKKFTSIAYGEDDKKVLKSTEIRLI